MSTKGLHALYMTEEALSMWIYLTSTGTTCSARRCSLQTSARSALTIIFTTVDAMTAANPASFFLYKFILFLFIFWLRWVFVAAWAFSSCGEQGLLFVAVRGLLIVVASLVAEHGL